MSKPMRRADRALDTFKTRALLSEAPYGVLSVFDGEGRPYGVPLSFALVGDTIYMHGTNEPSRKADSLVRPAAACFTAVGCVEPRAKAFSVGYESAIVEGTARVVRSAEERQTAFEALVAKYSSDYREQSVKYIAGMQDKTTVFALDIDTFSGKSSL